MELKAWQTYLVDVGAGDAVPGEAGRTRPAAEVRVAVGVGALHAGEARVGVAGADGVAHLAVARLSRRARAAPVAVAHVEATHA